MSFALWGLIAVVAILAAVAAGWLRPADLWNERIRPFFATPAGGAILASAGAVFWVALGVYWIETSEADWVRIICGVAIVLTAANALLAIVRAVALAFKSKPGGTNA